MSTNIDVFISYKREERSLSEKVKKALIEAGYTAVTDLNISKNDDFGDAIDTMIRTATLTLVLWTKASAESQWVRKEASLANDLEKAGRGNHYLGVLVEDVSLDVRADLRTQQMVNIHETGLNKDGLAIVLEAVKQILGAHNQQTAAKAEADSAALAEEWQLYDLARSINVAASYERYLRTYPNGEFAADARKQLGMFKWYMHPFRRGNLTHTVAALGIVGTIAATVWGATRDPVMVGVERSDYTAMETERDAALARIAELEPLVERAQAGGANASAALKQAIEDRDNAAEQIEDLTTQLSAARSATAALSQVREDLQEAERARTAAEEAISGWIAERDAAVDRATELEQLLAETREEAERALSREKAARLEAEKSLAAALERRTIAQSEDAKKLNIPEPDCETESGKPGFDIPEVNRCIAQDATSLNLDGSKLADLGPLAGLSSLRALDLDNTTVSDLSPLSNLLSLETLRLDKTNVADLSPLSGLNSLKTLSLWSTGVEDLSPLENKNDLRYLSILDTKVTDLSPLANSESLTMLVLAYSQVRDLSPLSELETLQILWLNRTGVEDLSPLAGLPSLKTLYDPDGKSHEGRDAVKAAIEEWSQ